MSLIDTFLLFVNILIAINYEMWIQIYEYEKQLKHNFDAATA